MRPPRPRWRSVVRHVSKRRLWSLLTLQLVDGSAHTTATHLVFMYTYITWIPCFIFEANSKTRGSAGGVACITYQTSFEIACHSAPHSVYVHSNHHLESRLKINRSIVSPRGLLMEWGKSFQIAQKVLIMSSIVFTKHCTLSNFFGSRLEHLRLWQYFLLKTDYLISWEMNRFIEPCSQKTLLYIFRQILSDWFFFF